MESENIFYVNSTFDFQDLCLCYSMYGAFQPPPEYAQLHEKRRQQRLKKRLARANVNAMQRYGGQVEAKDDKDANMDTDTGSASAQKVLFVNLMEEGKEPPHNHSHSYSHKANGDAWMSNAIRLYSNIQQISHLLQTHSQSYTHQHIFDIYSSPPIMQEEEVSMFESSIASFLTSTTGQMDELRQALLMGANAGAGVGASAAEQTTNSQIQTHKSGILTHLVTCLTNMTEEFKYMQMRRNRDELEMFHDPYKFCYQDPDVMEMNMNMESKEDMNISNFNATYGSAPWSGSGSGPAVGGGGGIVQVSEEYMDMVELEEEDFQQLYNHDDEEEEELERILVEETLFSFPQYHDDGERERGQGHVSGSRAFMGAGMENEEKEDRAPSYNAEQSAGVPLQQPAQSHPHPQPRPHVTMHQPGPMATPSTPTPTPTHNANATGSETLTYNRPTTNDILQQEQVFLTHTLQNAKLDSVQGVETQMMQITSLLSQFSSLVSEQQEEIQEIAEATKKSRQNVDQGREKLVQATEQKKKGRHYFAWIIFIMGLLLLFLNAVVA